MLHDIDTTEAYETQFGEVVCAKCGCRLECDDCGDMPDFCPECKSKILRYNLCQTNPDE